MICLQFIVLTDTTVAWSESMASTTDKEPSNTTVGDSSANSENHSLSLCMSVYVWVCVCVCVCVCDLVCVFLVYERYTELFQENWLRCGHCQDFMAKGEAAHVYIATVHNNLRQHVYFPLYISLTYH